jgi:hypothetical protein
MEVYSKTGKSEAQAEITANQVTEPFIIRVVSVILNEYAI